MFIGGLLYRPIMRQFWPAPPVEWMFDWAYADPPGALLRQRAEVLGDG